METTYKNLNSKKKKGKCPPLNGPWQNLDLAFKIVRRASMWLSSPTLLPCFQFERIFTPLSTNLPKKAYKSGIQVFKPQLRAPPAA